ncbi:MAG: hypothetical protein IJV35_00690 [Neisseriaceae bacterium]|nr:hypothetical protein [Neisseriaceae bacterium]
MIVLLVFIVFSGSLKNGICYSIFTNCFKNSIIETVATRHRKQGRWRFSYPRLLSTDKSLFSGGFVFE